MNNPSHEFCNRPIISNQRSKLILKYFGSVKPSTAGVSLSRTAYSPGIEKILLYSRSGMFIELSGLTKSVIYDDGSVTTTGGALPRVST